MKRFEIAAIFCAIGMIMGGIAGYHISETSTFNAAHIDAVLARGFARADVNDRLVVRLFADCDHLLHQSPSEPPAPVLHSIFCGAMMKQVKLEAK